MTEIVLDLRPLQGGDHDRGVGTYVRSLLDLDGVRRVIAWRDRELPGAPGHAEVVRVPGYLAPGRLGWVRDLAVSAASLRGLAVHAPALNASFGASPRIVTVHDAIPWRFPDLYPAGRLGGPRRRLEAGIARRAATVITGSRTAADDLIATLGVRAGVIHVIPYSGDPGWVDSSEAEAAAVRTRLGLPERYVVMAGGFIHPDPRKRLEDGVDALSLLPADVGLAITGREGPFSAPLRARMRSSGLDERVRLTGLLSTADLSALFRGATAFIFPSLWEGFGLPLLDAFRSGTPAVVSDGGALPEVAGGAAIVYPAGDVGGLASGLRSILDEPDRATELRIAGLARARDFSHDKVLAAHREVYEST